MSESLKFILNLIFHFLTVYGSLAFFKFISASLLNDDFVKSFISLVFMLIIMFVIKFSREMMQKILIFNNIKQYFSSAAIGIIIGLLCATFFTPFSF